MEQMIVKGPCTLSGEVRISGAKNAALPLLASSLLTSSPCTYKNVPALEDIVTMTHLFRQMGSTCTSSDDRSTIKVSHQNLSTPMALGDLVKAIRASVLLLGPLVARYGKASLSLPGGDAIGARPVDQHLRGLKAMGAHIEIEQGTILAHSRRLQGANIRLDMPTVGGTENIMMAATLAKGNTLIQNAAKEPEIEDLAQALIHMGARIEGAGTSSIQIEGVDELGLAEYTVMPDRIEAGTFLIAAMLCKGNITLTHCKPKDLLAPLEILRQAGAIIEQGDSFIQLKAPATLLPFDVITAPYPLFPTDLQAQFLTLSCLGNGTSTITETIFENRYQHVPELIKMGANIKVSGRTATVFGIPHFTKGTVHGTDLRASASLVLAGLAAHGTTSVSGIDHLDRGYERFEEKLSSLGAQISRITL